MKRLGSLSYTAFAGERQDTVHGGYIYMLESIGIYMDSYGGLQYGADLKWNTPLKGLLLGAAHMNQDITGRGKFILPGAAPETATPYEEHSNKDYATQFSAQYVRGNFRVEGEYRRWWRDQQIFNDTASVTTDTRGRYTAAAYRISKRLEFGIVLFAPGASLGR